MSIKGIDNQHMLTRMTDFMKDNSAEIKRSEVMQSHTSLQNKQVEEHEKSMVIKTSETDKTEIHPDKEGESQGYSPSGKRRNRENEKSTGDDILVAPDPLEKHKIDIRI